MKHTSNGNLAHDRSPGWPREATRPVSDVAPTRAVGAKPQADVFVHRISLNVWAVCRWNDDQGDAETILHTSENAATTHARTWAAAAGGHAWLVRADRSMTAIDQQHGALSPSGSDSRSCSAGDVDEGTED